MSVFKPLSSSIRHLCPSRFASFCHLRTVSTTSVSASKPTTKPWTPRPTANQPRHDHSPDHSFSRGLRTRRRMRPTKLSTEQAAFPLNAQSAVDEAATAAAPSETSTAPSEPSSSASESPSQPPTRTEPAAASKKPTLPPHYQPANLSPALPYHIMRTRTHNLPVYHLAKAGGNRKLTAIQKVKGNSQELLRELVDVLQPRPAEAWVNAVNGHIVVKGWYREQIERFLRGRGF